MRIELTFKVLRPGQKLPFSYQYNLAEWIYYCLSRGKRNFSKFLYYGAFRRSKHQFKLMSFSRLSIPQEGRKVFKRYLEVWAEEVKLELRFLVQEEEKENIMMAFEQRRLRLGDGRMGIELEVIKVEELQMPNIEDGAAPMRTQTPMILSRMEEHKGKMVPQYLHPMDQGYHKILLDRLIDNYQLASPHGLLAPAQELINGPELNFKLLSKKEDISRKGTDLQPHNPRFAERVIGYLFDFELQGPAEILRLAYLGGLGAKNAMGFGCVRFNYKE
ncbi:CRISPR-associated endoribonuclease Cas6 [Saprospira grandis]|uniref:CRISPR-associated endoribonuclease Cas6 n=1 Tax=Saprospira grandis TaxID=1008 RepID=UPI0022DD2DED|nr:CRISPR-associated endoribonuclease Cas6 [Saprospira grandis]WBM74235.1 CRISPR-associated endoribonuclease Cas6 [Saprospira grandis]